MKINFIPAAQHVSQCPPKCFLQNNTFWGVNILCTPLGLMIPPAKHLFNSLPCNNMWVGENNQSAAGETGLLLYRICTAPKFA